MKILYAPWRNKYFDNKEKSKNCPFCEKIAENNDEKNFILKRYDHCFVILNLYPYNAGHVLVIPYAHKPEIYELNQQEQQEFIKVISNTSKILKESLSAEGLNIGINIGTPSGGTIPDHLHCHVVPRWTGDTNFLVTSADIKQISFDLTDIYKKLLHKF